MPSPESKDAVNAGTTEAKSAGAGRKTRKSASKPKRKAAGKRSTRRKSARPKTTKPETAKAKSAKPKTTKSKTAKPKSAKAKATKSRTAKSKTTKSSTRAKAGTRVAKKPREALLDDLFQASFPTADARPAKDLDFLFDEPASAVETPLAVRIRPASAKPAPKPEAEVVTLVRATEPVKDEPAPIKARVEPAAPSRPRTPATPTEVLGPELVAPVVDGWSALAATVIYGSLGVTLRLMESVHVKNMQKGVWGRAAAPFVR